MIKLAKDWYLEYIKKQINKQKTTKKARNFWRGSRGTGRVQKLPAQGPVSTCRGKLDEL